MADFASREDSKYSIAFAKALTKCKTLVQFYDNDTPIAVNGGVIKKNANTVKIEYTDQYYNSGTPHPKVPPYPNIGTGEDIPFDVDFISGNNYKQMVGDHNGGEGKSGAGKKLDDLPLCIASPLRVDVIPSIASMSYYKLNETPLVENSLDFKAYVFGGNNPNQQVVWGATSGIVEASESVVTRVINGKSYTVTLADTGRFKPDKREKSESITVRATMFSEESVYGGAIVRLIPQIVSNLPISGNRYIPGVDMNIEGWVFGGGSKQNLQITLTNKTDPTTSYNPVTGRLVVGSNENAEYLTICMKDIVPPQFTPELEPLCINIYKN